MPRARPAGAPAIYQLKITLKYTAPPVWRRVQVADDTTLGHLHSIIQAAMGWGNDHLHAFRVGKAEYATTEGDMAVIGLTVRDEWEADVRAVLPKVGSKMLYIYDFGDSWKHEIRLEKILPPEEGKQIPICLAGARACPPEDCGGPSGYASLVAASSDPRHPDRRYWREWLGGNFDPEALDLEAVNRRLAGLA